MGHEHHEHDHEYMHAHNIPHDHEHEHCDDKTQAHCHGDCAKCGGDPRAELIAMMKYMVNHNTAHANELAGLAKQLQTLGDNTAFEQVMAVVSDFEKGNMRLSAVLAAMNIAQ